MKNNQDGFSLIELLLVIVMIGIIAAVAVPSLIRARESAEIGSAVSAMRTLATLQISFYSQTNRYGRLDEVLHNQNIRMGTYDDATKTLTRGTFNYQMEPESPTDEQLLREFKIVATRAGNGNSLPYRIEVDHTGIIDPRFIP